jgi:hypothetical protein
MGFIVTAHLLVENALARLPVPVGMGHVLSTATVTLAPCFNPHPRPGETAEKTLRLFHS